MRVGHAIQNTLHPNHPMSRRRLEARVTVSKTVHRSPEKRTQTPPVGLNPLHEARLITSLVEYYGWSLCADGNLYNPRPVSSTEERHAA